MKKEKIVAQQYLTCIPLISTPMFTMKKITLPSRLSSKQTLVSIYLPVVTPKMIPVPDILVKASIAQFVQNRTRQN